MITQPTNILKLAEAQQEVIEKAKMRLSNLELENKEAKKNLIILTKDVAKATKEVSYQNELLQHINSEITDKEKLKESLEASTSELLDYLNQVKAEAAVIKVEQQEKSDEIIRRLTELANRENDFIKRNENFKKEEDQQRDQGEKLEVAAEAFRSALKTVFWK